MNDTAALPDPDHTDHRAGVDIVAEWRSAGADRRAVAEALGVDSLATSGLPGAFVSRWSFDRAAEPTLFGVGAS